VLHVATMIEVALIDDGWDPTSDWTALAARCATAAIAATPRAAIAALPILIEISVRLSSDAEVQKLNAAYRGKDQPTNVLSFPMFDPGALDALASTTDPEILLGDIVLARETCAAEAVERGISLEAHATHLVVHGVLHLLGYDHMTDNEAETMEGIERTVLGALGLHDPYED
jgi:probable rRNA maturation factor